MGYTTDQVSNALDGEPSIEVDSFGVDQEVFVAVEKLIPRNVGALSNRSRGSVL